MLRFNLKNNLKNRFLIFCWALYDFANQFFVINIVSLHFIRWVTIVKGVSEFFYSLFFGISTFLVALASPIIGAFSDLSQRRMPFLIWFTELGILFTLFLGTVDNVYLALVFFAVANFGVQLAVIFYNALLSQISDEKNISLISGIGRAFGYSGAILAIYSSRSWITRHNYQSIFLFTGTMFFIFSLPCILFIKDKSNRKIEWQLFLKKERILFLVKESKKVLRDIRDNYSILNFLKASFWGLCVVNAVIVFMSAYVSRVFGWNDSLVVKLVFFSTFFAILGSLCSAYLPKFYGYKRSLIIMCILWFLVIFSAAFARRSQLIWLVGPLVGFALSSSWVVFRAYLISILAKEVIGEIFGIFNLLGYLSSVTGSLSLGGLFSLFSYLGEYGYRLSIWFLNIFIVFSLIYILRLPKENLKKS